MARERVSGRRHRHGGRRGSLTAISGVLVTALLVGGPLASAYADDAHHQQYSVLYGGNYSPGDAHRFSYRLAHYGGTGSWVGKTQTSYDPRETDVAHWDVTNGNPGIDPWQGANQRDLMYLSTHGWPGQMRFYSPRWVGSTAQNADWRRRIDQNRKNDNIGPRKGDLCGSSTRGWENNLWEIGATYKPSSVTRTNSRWNDDIEWAFLAACDQLSASGNSPGSRALYARTLLGDPRRAHSIMGYRATAPGDATDVDIVNSLFNLLGQGRSIRYSWLQANSLYSGSARNAAVILHAKHLHEGLPPVSPRESDSPTGGTVDIRYWYLNTLGNPVGGTQVSSGDSFWSRTAGSLRQLLSTSPAIADEQQRVIRGRDVTFRLASELPAAPKGVGPLVLKQEDRSATKVAESVLGGLPVTASSDASIGVTKLTRGSRSLFIFEGGGYVLQEDDEYGDDSVDFDRADAVDIAERYLSEIEGLPPDALIDEVTEVNSARLDPLTGEMSEDSTHAYIVEYRHEHDGIPIVGNEGDAINVVVSADRRVCQVRNVWRDIARAGQPVVLIDAAEALETLAVDGERATGVPPVATVTGARLVYYANKSSSRQAVMWPAWEFTLVGEGEDENAAPAKVFVDARTGKVVSD